MMKYIALLRGINVGGNNKVAMLQLKTSFESLGFSSVRTYINSGNVIFETDETPVTTLIQRCEAIIATDFGFAVTCNVIPAAELENAVVHAPEWWGLDDQDKHNAIFVIPPATASQVMQQVGDSKPEYEKTAHYGSVIFWTAPIETFGKTRYSKIVGTSAYKSVTIRNSKTTKKLVELSKQ